MKTKDTKRCTCKAPKPTMKCSENGIVCYCFQCGKTYKNLIEK